MTLLQSGIAKPSSGYDIDQSLRFSDGYLRKSFSSGTNPDKVTISCWVKPANLGATATTLFYGYTDASNYEKVVWNATGSLYWNRRVSGSVSFEAYTSMVFRDPSSWYHLVLVYDSTDVTTSSRIKFYVNGVLQTKSVDSPTPPTNLDSLLLSASCTVGEDQSSSNPFKSYMAECHAIDGQALTPASFGETNSATNQWQAVKYAGSYGTNGFYLKFQDSSALGDDSSGNTNDFTATNLVATDQVLDSPTRNYCTLNPLVPIANASSTFPTLSEGNLKWSGANAGYYSRLLGTIPMTSGKWYWEVYNKDITSVGWTEGRIGIFSIKSLEEFAVSTTGSHDIKGTLLYSATNGKLQSGNGTGTPDDLATLSTYTNGDIIGIAVDMDASTILLYKNGSVQNSGTAIAFSAMSQPNGIADGALPWFNAIYSQHSRIVNFGQDSSFAGEKTAQGNGGDGEDFYYTPPTGYKALNSSNLDDPAIALPGDNFNTILYTGTGANQSITGAGFQPDMVWIKTRNAVMDCQAADSVRGINRFLYTSSNDAEVDRTSQDDAVRSFDADGFSYGTNSGNFSGELEVSWLWKAGGTASSNGDGSIPSSVSANTTAGFSIVSYTSPGTSADGTIGHGLSQAPELVIVKNRDSAYNWDVWNTSLSSGYDLILNTTAAQTSGRWSTTIPTASLVTLKDTYEVNGTDKYIAYCFHSVEGYSKVGSYTGNANANGPFVYTGFKPAFLLIKRIAGVQDWMLADNKISPYNQTEYMLRPAQSAVEQSGNTIDILSNGFKLRLTGNAFNASGESYLVLAIAESPFKTSNAR